MIEVYEMKEKLVNAMYEVFDELENEYMIGAMDHQAYIEKVTKAYKQMNHRVKVVRGLVEDEILSRNLRVSIVEPEADRKPKILKRKRNFPRMSLSIE